MTQRKVMAGADLIWLERWETFSTLYSLKPNFQFSRVVHVASRTSNDATNQQPENNRGIAHKRTAEQLDLIDMQVIRQATDSNGNPKRTRTIVMKLRKPRPIN